MTRALAVPSRSVAAGAPFSITHFLQPAMRSRPVVEATTSFSRSTSGHWKRATGLAPARTPARYDPVAAGITGFLLAHRAKPDVASKVAVMQADENLPTDPEGVGPLGPSGGLVWTRPSPVEQ